MLDLDTLHRMNAEAARIAHQKGLRPYLITNPAQIESATFFPFPYLGDACDDWDSSWERLDDLFVDSSGFGREDEPALTFDQFKEVLLELLAEHGLLYAAVAEAGEFQVWIALWTKKSEEAADGP